MYTNNKIAKAVRLAIAFGAASTLTMHSVAVNAQEEAAAEQQVASHTSKSDTQI